MADGPPVLFNIYVDDKLDERGCPATRDFILGFIKRHWPEHKQTSIFHWVHPTGPTIRIERTAE